MIMTAMATMNVSIIITDMIPTTHLKLLSLLPFLLS
jgi:hypothetical protein